MATIGFAATAVGTVLVDGPGSIWKIDNNLVIGQDGRRLAKRHGDSRVTAYRQQGVRPERILGLLADWCGLGPRGEISADEFLARFELVGLPKGPIVFMQEDDAWLRG